MDDPIYDIELEDCPICRGAGLIQDEQGWSVSVACMDCGAETAHAEYRTPEERLEAALVQAAWSAGRFQPGRPSLWPRKHSFFSVIAF